MTKLTITKKDISPIESIVNDLYIRDSVSMTQATEYLSKLNTYLDSVIEYKESKTKPLNVALKIIREETKPLETQLESLIDTIRQRMSEYHTKEIQARLEAETRISERIKDGKGNLTMETALSKIDQLAEVTHKVETDAGAVSFQTRQELDIYEITQLPRSYLIPNEAKIKADLKAGVAIRGARMKEVQVVVNKRR